jgi:hypothetical protein
MQSLFSSGWRLFIPALALRASAGDFGKRHIFLTCKSCFSKYNDLL